MEKEEISRWEVARQFIQSLIESLDSDFRMRVQNYSGCLEPSVTHEFDKICIKGQGIVSNQKLNFP